MRKYINTVYHKKELLTITCNVCGKSIERNQFGYFEDFISLEKTWGYGSEFDGETHDIDICQDCYKKLFKTLKVSPIQNETISF